ncbi:hypothetical protein [Pseudochryseolinea flava]|uniref:PEGA domain-containing protein n=1 Tax=Pseudochryseolinea flava TaxID=2059302 RepID=A0A364Y1N5_9BACT|nr:hypothetical protein [Pseudochryseolinea flava]RAV99859.1 hypothetical protein DQQ10_17620 [Pseudochryseolinea flava]
MKLKHLICLTGILLPILSATAQIRVRDFPDSIRIELPEYNAVATFEMKELFVDKQVLSQFPDSLKRLLVLIRKGLPDDVAQLDPHKIEVRYVRTHYDVIAGKERTNGRPLHERLEVTIHKQDPPVTTMTIVKGQVAEVLPPAWKLTIHHERYRVTVYAEDFVAFERLGKEDFTPVTQAIEKDPQSPYIGRKSIIARVILKNGQVNYNTIEYKTPGDFLGIHPGAGVGLYKGNLYPELSVAAALYFSNRFGQMRSRIEATLETKFFWPQGETGRFNATFLSVGYSRNFRKSSERPRWVGIGAGYLVHQKSSIASGESFMGPKTLKLFVMSDIGNGKLNIIPEFYFHDMKFKNFDFGMKLTYRF